MKKIIIVIMLVFLTSCKTENNEVPLVIYDMDDPYINQFAHYIADSTNNEYKYSIFDSENNQILQNSQIKDSIEKNPKVLIVNPVDRLGSYTTIDLAKEAGIPLILFNREPLYEDLRGYNQVYYVGALAAQSAMIQAELVNEAFGVSSSLNEYDKNADNIIQLVILKGEQGHQDAEERTSVVIDVLESNGYQLEILTISVANWNTDTAYENMIGIIDEYGISIELVISNNDAMAIGAINALLDKKLFTDVNEDGNFNKLEDTFIPVIGVDGLDEALELMEEGLLYGTVINDFKDMADKMIELSEALATGKDVNTLSFEIDNGKYVWVPYKKYE